MGRFPDGRRWGGKAMLFNVAGLLNDDIGATRGEALRAETIETPDGVFENIEGTVEMLRTDSTVLVTAELITQTAQTCSRCLEPAHLDLEILIEEEFRPANADLTAGAYRGHREPEDPPDDQALVIDDRNMLNLSEVIRQALIAALPMAPLCRPDCAGICPVCSRDRNREPCDCEEEIPDSALAPLAKLLTRDAN